MFKIRLTYKQIEDMCNLNFEKKCDICTNLIVEEYGFLSDMSSSSSEISILILCPGCFKKVTHSLGKNSERE